MHALLNSDSIAAASPLPEAAVKGIMMMAKRIKPLPLTLFGENIVEVRRAVLSYFPEYGRGWVAANIVPPYMPAGSAGRATPMWQRLSAHDYVTLPHGAGHPLSARAMACASLSASVSVGIADGAYGNDFSYGVHERDLGSGVETDKFTSLMPTQPQHLSEIDFVRWKYVATLDVHDAEGHGVSYPDRFEFKKHFNTDNPDFIPESKWTKMPWVADTAKERHEALFLPGLKYKSVAFFRLVGFVLREAYRNSRYTQREQNGFILDVGIPIGAAAGKVTNNVKIYISEQNVVHIRPCEQVCDARAIAPFAFAGDDACVM